MCWSKSIILDGSGHFTCRLKLNNPLVYVSLCVLSYYVSLRSEFHVVMSVTISAWKRCSVRLYLQLIEYDSLMSHGMCVCLRRVVFNIYCVVFLLCFSSSCVPYVASFSVFLLLVYPMLPVSLDCTIVIVPLVFSNAYLK